MRTFGSKRWMCWAAGLGLFAAVVSAGVSLAAEDPIERFSLAGQVGAGTLAMKDVNDRIQDGNEFLSRWGKTELDDLTYGFNFTWDLRTRLSQTLLFSLGGGLITGKSEINFDQVISVEPKSAFYYARMLYQLPFRPRPNLILRVGGGPVYLSSVELTVRHESRTTEAGTVRVETATFDGDGWGAQGMLEGELVLSEKVTLVADIGYRQAVISRGGYDWSITGLDLPQGDEDADGIPNQYDFTENSFLPHSFLEVEIGPDGRPRTEPDGRTVTTPVGSGDIDFSGVQANVGLRFYLF